MPVEKIAEPTSDPLVNIARDTFDRKKQALVFVNSKRSAEKVAEDISKKSGIVDVELESLAKSIEGVLAHPTKQCKRLAMCARKGVAFHHSGLHSKQKELVEEAFRSGKIKLIACTPTLAAGINLPAFRAIVRDVRRFGPQGMAYIPVLEFLQMAGRAGRPGFDDSGEVIVIAQTSAAKEHSIDHYLLGEPESIYSKLAVEPALRMYVLSLINSRVVKTHDELLDFFSRTFWAHQFNDFGRIESIIDRVLGLLIDWGFVNSNSGSYRSTILGKRVAELYIDPYTANSLLSGLARWKSLDLKAISFLQLVCFSLEMRPFLRVKQKELENIEDKSASLSSYLMHSEPSMWDPEYDSWLSSMKTALMLNDYIDEKDEVWILERYDCRPGELRVKCETANWLLYACYELARLKRYQPLLKDIMKIRLRLRHGVREELLPLIRLKGIGRVRARKLFNAGIKDVGAIRRAPLASLSMLVGESVAKSIKEQVSERGSLPV